MSEQLTMNRLVQTVHQTLRDLNLTTRCYDITSNYIDYVSVTFFVPKAWHDDAKIIEGHFAVLADEFDWLLPNVTVYHRNNEIHLNLLKSTAIPTGWKARLPQ